MKKTYVICARQSKISRSQPADRAIRFVSLDFRELTINRRRYARGKKLRNYSRNFLFSNRYMYIKIATFISFTTF